MVYIIIFIIIIKKHLLIMSLCCTRKMLNVYFLTFLLSYLLRQVFPDTQRVLKNTRHFLKNTQRVLRKSRHPLRAIRNIRTFRSLRKELLSVNSAFCDSARDKTFHLSARRNLWSKEEKEGWKC